MNIFETYCITKFPMYRLEVINAALPSETVSRLSEFNHADGKFPRPCLFTRLPSVLERTKADVVFACYGMNDGGMIKLHNALKSAGVAMISVYNVLFVDTFTEIPHWFESKSIRL